MNIAKLFAESMKKMTEIREELQQALVVGTSGGGAVKAVVSGLGDLLELTISPEVIHPEEPEMLQDLVIAAVRDGVEKARELQKEKAAALTGGLQIPGMFG
jgi:hypothetical protein